MLSCYPELSAMYGRWIANVFTLADGKAIVLTILCLFCDVVQNLLE